MGSLIQKIKERKAAKEARLAEEQRQKIERLQQLEKESKKKGFRILNPIKAIKNNKEMKQLREEIAAFEQRKNGNSGIGLLIGCTAILVILFGFIGVMVAMEQNSSTSKIPVETVAIAVVETSEIENSASNIVETPIETATVPEASEGIPISREVEPSTSNTVENSPEPTVEQAASTSEPAPSVTEATSSEETEASSTDGTESIESNLPVLLASDLSVQTVTDYAHVGNGICLGVNEGVTITITAPAGTTQDELIIYGDDTLLDISLKSIDDTSSNTKAYFKLYITGKEICDTEVVIATAYELETKGDNAELFVVDICKLNSTDGQIVFTTPTGEKYHSSADCAGENAIKTTYKDAIACEYEPCRKCIN